jgi:hypothetical protein
MLHLTRLETLLGGIVLVALCSNFLLAGLHHSPTSASSNQGNVGSRTLVASTTTGEGDTPSPDEGTLRRRKRRRREQRRKELQEERRKQQELIREGARANDERIARHEAEYEALSDAQKQSVIVMPDEEWYQMRYFAPIVAEKFKLLFVPIPKVACTQWLQLLRRMEGQANWLERKLGLPYTPHMNGLTYLADYNVTEATEIFTSPEWTRAVFVRDPKERFLSAYLDKVVNSQNIVLGSCCEDTWDCASSNTTFADFVNMTDTCENEHWSAQNQRLPAKYWQYMNFVGHMESLTVDSERLLRKIGAWEAYGRSGWGSGGNQSIFTDGAGETEARRHATKANERLRQFYTPELETKLDARFEEDYENAVFQIPRQRILSEVLL